MPRDKLKPPHLYIEMVEGVEGPSLYLNGYRIAGPKPWGGGTLSRKWRTSKKNIERALKDSCHKEEE